LISYRLDNLLYLRTSSSSQRPILVANGFSTTTTKEADIDSFLRAQELVKQEYGFGDQSVDYWCQSDQYGLVNALSRSLSEAGEDWHKIARKWATDVEEEGERFAFLKLPW